MPLPPSGIVTVRLAPRDADAIDALVEEGRFTSRSDFLRHAVRAAVTAARADADLPDIAMDGPGALATGSESSRPGARARRAAPSKR